MSKANMRIIVVMLASLMAGGCAHQKTAIDSESQKPIKAANTLTLSDASRIAKANVVELNKVPISGDWYEAIIQFPNENKGVVYIEANKKHMIAGAIFDARTGVNLTAQKMAQMGVKPPSPSLPDAVPPVAQPAVTKIAPNVVVSDLAKIKKQTKVFHYGRHSKAEPLTVFVDPQCPFCHKAWPAIMSLSKTNPVDVVVVGFLGPQSEQMTAYLNKQDTKSLDAVMRGEKPGLDANQTDIQAVRNVSAAVVNMGISGVPAFSRKGKVVTGFTGLDGLHALLN